MPRWTRVSGSNRFQRTEVRGQRTEDNTASHLSEYSIWHLSSVIFKNMKRFFGNKNFTVGFILTSIVLIAALVSAFWTPYDSNRMNVRARLQGPSLSHPLGTDHYGRDTLSRVMVGAVNSIIVGLVTVAIGLSVGVLLGLASAYYGRWVDESIMRFSDLLFGFPAVLSAILITSILGPSMVNAMLAIGIFYIPIFARLTRAVSISIWEREYIAAAGQRCE